MIPAIGFMVGMYIITKMVAYLSDSSKNVLVKLLAVITILVCIVSIYDLVQAGTRVRSEMPAVMR